MTDLEEITDEQKAFLEPFLPVERADGKPFVTLTYAQSLDSMIALGPGLRTSLSGSESKSMTHYLRQHHDAILIGTGTAQADNPSLNCRYPGATLEQQPRPVIVGSHLPGNWIQNCKATGLAEKGEALSPWSVVANVLEEPSEVAFHWEGDVLQIDQSRQGRINWVLVLKGLEARGIKSVMIEGGANIINEMIHMPNLVDRVIITIAPVFLGRRGVQVSPRQTVLRGEPIKAATFADAGISWCQFGGDMVMSAKPDPLQIL